MIAQSCNGLVQARIDNTPHSQIFEVEAMQGVQRKSVAQKMLNKPIISFSTATPDGLEHIAAVYADDTAFFVITEDTVITDALSPNTYVYETAPETGDAGEFARGDFADLPRAALQLMAGHRALEAALTFQREYDHFMTAVDPDEPIDDNSGFDDDDLNLDEGVML